MSLIWEPIREAAEEFGWRHVAKQFFALIVSLAAGVIVILILAGLGDVVAQAIRSVR